MSAVVTDVVFALDQPTIEARRDVVLNVSGLLSLTDTHADRSAYRRTVVDVIHGLHDQGREVSLLAHVLSGHPLDNDEAVLHDVQEQSGADLELLVPDSLNQARSIIAGSRLTIGSRMHVC